MADEGEEGEIIKGTRRPDGTWRKDRRRKAGYVPPEEQKTYDKWKKDTSPGANLPPGLDPEEAVKSSTSAKTKNQIKNEKRKQKKSSAEGNSAAPTPRDTPREAPDPVDTTAPSKPAAQDAAPAQPAKTAAEMETGAQLEVSKKIKAINKKLRQVEELKAKDPATLNAEQKGKIEAEDKLKTEKAYWDDLVGVDIDKKIKALRKKIRQVEDLEEKQTKGDEMDAGQLEKIQKKPEVQREMATLSALLGAVDLE